MRHATLTFIAAAALLALTAAAQQEPTQPETRPQRGTTGAQVAPDAKAALEDIRRTLGSVPGFFRILPDEALPGAWATMKAVQMNPDSAIPAKNKELIGLAVSAQIPCDYCVYFHTEAAKANGATDAEIEHTLAEAALTRFMSTWLNGSGTDMAQFRKEIDSIASRMQRQATAGTTSTGRRAQITDAASARKDIQETFGTMPSFLAAMPDDALAGVWSQWRAIEMGGGPVPEKYLLLTSLAVASQVPCDYCVVADRAFAQSAGASQQELKEAVLVAATVREFSTLLNGAGMDPKQFRKDVDQVMNHARKQQRKR